MNLCRNLYRSLCRFLVGDDVSSLPLCRNLCGMLRTFLHFVSHLVSFITAFSDFEVGRWMLDVRCSSFPFAPIRVTTFREAVSRLGASISWRAWEAHSCLSPNQNSKFKIQKCISYCLLIPFLFTGCLSRPALVHQTYALHTSPPEKRANSSSQGILSVRQAQISPLFERRSFAYRTGPDRYELDPYAEFMVLPSRAVAIPVRSYLRASGVFQDVTEPGSELMPNAVLELHADELYGDFRAPGQPAAVLTIRMLLFDSETGQQKLVLQKTYSQRVPLKEHSAAALAAGWNQALTQIMSEAVNDFASVHAKTASQ